MPTWDKVLEEVQTESKVSPLDKIRRKYLKRLANYTGKSTIAYYSGWLHARPGVPGVYVDDGDMNSFMTCVHNEDRSNGLDLILHTPGGDLAATEAIVAYLRKMYPPEKIRAIVPQLAMSAGTLLACASCQIVMGKQSSIGPIDPQINGVPAVGVLREFELAKREAQQNQSCIPLWQTIIGKYHPTFLLECSHAVNWSRDILREWLLTCMLKDDPAGDTKAQAIIEYLSEQDNTKSHSRHYSMQKLIDDGIGLTLVALEDDGKLQDLVLTVHHAFLETFNQSAVVKIVENGRGVGMLRHLRQQ